MEPARRRILVADDDADVLHVVCRALELEGAEVVRAHSGHELLSRLGEGTYALVITDVAMPSMTGIEAVRSARRLGSITPVIVMTALYEPTIVPEIDALGSDVVLLRKPFDLDGLYGAVAKLLDAAA